MEIILEFKSAFDYACMCVYLYVKLYTCIGQMSLAYWTKKKEFKLPVKSLWFIGSLMPLVLCSIVFLIPF